MRHGYHHQRHFSPRHHSPIPSLMVAWTGKTGNHVGSRPTAYHRQQTPFPVFGLTGPAVGPEDLFRTTHGSGGGRDTLPSERGPPTPVHDIGRLMAEPTVARRNRGLRCEAVGACTGLCQATSACLAKGRGGCHNPPYPTVIYISCQSLIEQY